MPSDGSSRISSFGPAVERRSDRSGDLGTFALDLGFSSHFTTASGAVCGTPPSAAARLRAGHQFRTRCISGLPSRVSATAMRGAGQAQYPPIADSGPTAASDRPD